MAYLLANQSWSPSTELCLLILASAAFYLGGMVLNDVFDLKVDRVERPGRPLPTGEISHGLASKVGYVLLFVGITLSMFAGWLGNHGAALSLSSPFGRCLFIAVLLALGIYLYDGPLKRTVFAPLVMGACRSLNILLGASTFIPLATNLEQTSHYGALGLPMIVWWVAGAVGVLVAGVTLLGRREAATNQSRIALGLGGLGIIAGLVAIATTAYRHADFEIPIQIQQMFPLFVGLVSLTIVRRVIEAVFTAKPAKIQAAVISVLRSLIIFDAMICYLVATNNFVYAIVVLALLIPSMMLSKVISST